MTLDHTLLQGDCIKIMQSMPADSVDAIITDPPYGIDYQSARRIDKAQRLPKIHNDAKPFVWWLPEAARLLKVGGALLCFCRWDVQEAFRLAIEWAGLSLQSQVIWDREVHGLGDLSASFAPRHDVIWFAVKGKFKFPAARPMSVIRSPRVPAEELVHPNQKPVELMAQLIEAVSQEGDTILDPFAGSGSTGVACAQTGRRFVGCELDADHHATASRRLAGLPPQNAPGQIQLFPMNHRS